MPTPCERVAVVILNFNKRQDVLACLESVLRSTVRPAAIVAVDNGSTDGSADAIAKAFPSVRLIRNPVNLGACVGRNIGWRYVVEQLDVDAILFLDNDSMVEANCLARLWEALRDDPQAGIACGKGYSRFPSTTIMSAGMTVNLSTAKVCDRGAGLVDDGRFDQAGYVDACGGFAFLLRMDVMAQLRGFDERFSPLR